MDTSQPAVVTSQPAVATIPAGLPKGLTTITYNASSTVESFVASVGASTTLVSGLGPSASVTEGSSVGVSEPTGKGGNNGGGNNGGNSGSSSTSSDNAAPTMKAAAGMIALGAFAAALF